MIGVWSRTWTARAPTASYTPGVAPRHAAGQRGGHPAQGQGQVQRVEAERRRPVPQVRDQPRACPKVVEEVYGIKAPERAAERPRAGVPHRRPRPEPAGQGHAVGDDPAQPDDRSPARPRARLGVIGGDKNGYPNGRRLADDVLDISLQVVEGELVGAAERPGRQGRPQRRAFGGPFPYIGLPTSGSMSVNSGAGALRHRRRAAGDDAGDGGARSPGGDERRHGDAAGLTPAAAGLDLLGAGSSARGAVWLRRRRSRPVAHPCHAPVARWCAWCAPLAFRTTGLTASLADP